MKRFLIISIALLFAFSSPLFARSKVDEQALKDSLQLVQLENLKKEVDALQRIRLEKANLLEKKDADHWRARYKENRMTEDHEQEASALEGRYSKLSSDIGRLSEERVASQNATTDFQEKAQGVEAASLALNLQVIQTIEKVETEVPGDYPVGMEMRLLSLSKARAEAEKKTPNTLGAMNLFLEDQLSREKFTYTQDFGTRNSQMGSRAEVPVYRLRLGTIFLAEAARENQDIQALLRTGSLQGKIFEWNNEMPPSLSQGMRTAVTAVEKGEKVVWIPLDVLQNKAIKNSTAGNKEKTRKEAFLIWFHDGGIVMYPLALVAFLALMLCIERFITLTYRGRTGGKFMTRFYSLVDSNEYEKAMDLCLKVNSSLSAILFSIVRNAEKGRDAAEKGLKEAMLREQPKLEKRMGILAALGTIAPLLGLLGTVTGIITLFTVITQVGTNDARVLAGGISEALITTEAGLVIAIPAMMIHGFLSEKLEKVMSELYIQSTVSLNLLFPTDTKVK
jgi:biopolymer transport protein ExbB